MGPVEAGTQRDLERLPVQIREGGDAAIALTMARRIDDGEGSPSECGKVLQEALARLRELAPPKETHDTVDEIAQRRERRRGAAS